MSFYVLPIVVISMVSRCKIQQWKLSTFGWDYLLLSSASSKASLCASLGETTMGKEETVLTDTSSPHQKGCIVWCALKKIPCKAEFHSQVPGRVLVLFPRSEGSLSPSLYCTLYNAFSATKAPELNMPFQGRSLYDFLATLLSKGFNAM